MAEVRLAPIAQADFDEIVDYLSSVAGSRVASDYAEQLRSCINNLAMSPGIGSPRPHLGPEARLTGVHPYLVFYDGGPQSETVHILRILHGRRNITPALIARGRRP